MLPFRLNEKTNAIKASNVTYCSNYMKKKCNKVHMHIRTSFVLTLQKQKKKKKTSKETAF